MKFINKALLAAAVLAPFAAHAFPDVVTSGAKNVILVHGAYADGSTWRQIHDQLWLKGYKITVVQQPQTTLDENVAATRAAIEAQDGTWYWSATIPAAPSSRSQAPATK